MKDPKERQFIKDFFDFKDVIGYFFRVRKQDDKPDFNLRMMHGINKISIIIFLIAIIILIIRNLLVK